MIMDFHTHIKVSKRSPFMPSYFQEMIAEAKAAGLQAVALTEHFNTDRFMDVYNYLDEHYPYKHGYYEVDDFRVFPGMEIDVKEVGQGYECGLNIDRFNDIEVGDIVEAFEEVEVKRKL